VSRAVSTVFAGAYLVARHKFHQLFYSLEIDSVILDEPSDAFEPDNVVCRVITVLVAATRTNQSVLLINSEGLVGYTEKFCNHSMGKRGVSGLLISFGRTAISLSTLESKLALVRGAFAPLCSRSRL
jgi:hypothetical protein